MNFQMHAMNEKFNIFSYISIKYILEPIAII